MTKEDTTSSSPLTLDKLLDVMRSLPKIERIVTSDYIPRGTAYRCNGIDLDGSRQMFVVVNSDDAAAAGWPVERRKVSESESEP